MTNRTERSLAELADELLRRLDTAMAETGNRNFAVARIKVTDAVMYIRRGAQDGKGETDKGQERTI